MGVPQLRPELLKHARQRQNFRSHVWRQFEELRLKLVADLNNPWHSSAMTVSQSNHWQSGYDFEAQLPMRIS